MVESTKGDGIDRKVMYSIWRDDKPADPGYLKELINADTPREFWDDMDNLPVYG